VAELPVGLGHQTVPAPLPGGRTSATAVLVAQFFPPFNSVASHRALRMARALREDYERVVVMTLPSGRLPAEYLDFSMAREELADPGLQVHEIAPQLSGYGLVARPRLLHRLIGYTLTRVFCSTGADWVLPLGRALRRLVRTERIALIVSTGGPFLPFLPVTALAQKIGVPCALDYRDLWSQNPRGPYPRWARWIVKRMLEPRVNARATTITTVSEGCRRSLQNGSGAPLVHTLLNSPDRRYVEWFRTLKPSREGIDFDPGFLNIVLTGTVYRECTCRLLVRALERLPPATRTKVRLHYYGWSVRVVAPEFSASGLAECLVDHGYVSKAVAAAAVKNADLLLSLVFDSSAAEKTDEVLGSMTTKVFDYFLSGRPIINIGPQEADLCVLASNIGYREFRTFDSAQEAQLAEYLTWAIAHPDALRTQIEPAVLPDFSTTFRTILRTSNG
jgi:hypothetical protein